MRCGLIGESLRHSFSPRLHGLLADYDYQLFEVPPRELEHFLRHTRVDGLNVTIPYKQAVIPYCSSLSPAARRIGSVNTLIFQGEGRIFGHNTDYDGFAYMVQQSGLGLKGKKVLLLGSGGTSRTVAAVAEDFGARDMVVISRRGEHHYGNLQLHADADIIVNTTPVGMYPHVENSPLSLSGFPRLSGLLDVVYNPLRTRLMQQAQAAGIPCLGGLAMLVAQARAAAELFTGRPIPEEKMRRTLSALAAEKENIVLIGMPGCGKSTIGAKLARLIARPLFDTDDMVMELAGMSIEEIFATQGETAFREWERQAVAQAAANCGAIIATGGGTVLKEENCRVLSQNGRFYFIERSLDKLPPAGRPLSINLPALYAKRLPIYQYLAAATINNDSTIEQAAQRLLAVHQKKERN